MFLHRIHLDPRCKEVRRDLADPYQLHSTLCRAFSEPDKKCPQGEFLWRLEPETDPAGLPRILVQSRSLPDWDGIGVRGWLASADPAVDLKERLQLDTLKVGQRFRFRLRANPCVTRQGKRWGLKQTDQQEAWLERQAKQNGFALPMLPSFDLSVSTQARVDVRISQEQLLRGRQHAGNEITVHSVLYDGLLTIVDSNKFIMALRSGFGHAKVMGLGLLSIVPVP